MQMGRVGDELLTLAGCSDNVNDLAESCEALLAKEKWEDNGASKQVAAPAAM